MNYSKRILRLLMVERGYYVSMGEEEEHQERNLMMWEAVNKVEVMLQVRSETRKVERAIQFLNEVESHVIRDAKMAVKIIKEPT